VLNRQKLQISAPVFDLVFREILRARLDSKNGREINVQDSGLARLAKSMHNTMSFSAGRPKARNTVGSSAMASAPDSEVCFEGLMAAACGSSLDAFDDEGQPFFMSRIKGAAIMLLPYFF